MNKMIMTTITVALCATILRGNDAERLAELERICAFVPCDDLTFPEVVPTPADIISKYHVTTNQVAIDLKTIATKYPNVARNFFEAKGMDVEIVKIEGSVELAPLLDLSDGIVDIGTQVSDLRIQ